MRRKGDSWLQALADGAIWLLFKAARVGPDPDLIRPLVTASGAVEAAQQQEEDHHAEHQHPDARRPRR